MVNQNKKQHCVYALIDKFGVVRDIGEGTISRSRKISGRTKQFQDIYEDNGDILILYDKLNKKEARNMEYSLLARYKNFGIKGFNLINKTITSLIVNDLSYEDCYKYFELSDNSASGIVWKNKISKVTIKGKIAGSLDGRGYYRVQLLGKRYCVHRIVWILYNKQNLDEYSVVDHLDSNPSNNNPANLNKTTQQLNSLKAVRVPKINRFHHKTTGISRTVQMGGKLYRYRVSVVSPCGKVISKSFSIKKYGEELALHLAEKWRKDRLYEFYNYQ